ncbi:MAG: OmpH family outer membrane protein [Succinivibrionaceae bacterium]
MKKLLAGFLFSVLIATSSLVSAGTPTSVAVINLPQIMSEIPQAKQSKQRIDAEFATRQAEMKKLSAQYNSLVEKLKKNGSYMKEQEYTNTQRKAQELQAQLQIKGQALSEDLRKRVSEEENKILDKIAAAVEKIAKQRGFDLVLNGVGTAMYANDSIDISKEVIQLVSKSN